MPFPSPNVLFADLLHDEEVASAFNEEATLGHYLAFEVALAKALAAAGMADEASAVAVENTAGTFQPNHKAIQKAVANDGVPIAEFVRQLKVAIGTEHVAAVHTGSTSQDVMDTATVLSLKAVNAILQKRAAAVGKLLDDFVAEHGAAPLMARTRMQAAKPFTLGDRMRPWRHSIAKAALKLNEAADDLSLQLGGAVGTASAYGEKADEIRQSVASSLGIAASDCWHSERGGIVSYADALSQLTGALGKMGQDVALMVQQGLDEISLQTGGGSSAMPHKKNPVKAEVLVTLARYNAVQLSGMHQSLVHEQERSGAAWTLEWMLLPSMCVAGGKALATAEELVNGLALPKKSD